MNEGSPPSGRMAHPGNQGMRGRRYAQVIRLKSQAVEEYKRAHAAVWPGVLVALADANIRNYSIFLHGTVLVGYFEHTGENLAVDQGRLKAHPESQEWGRLMAEMQEPLPDRRPGEWWADMEEVFHLD